MSLLRTLLFFGAIQIPTLAGADGLDQWMTRTSPVPISITDVAYAKDLFVAIGSDTNTGGPRLIVSSNGMDWNRFTSFAQFTPTAITYGSNGLFVALGRTGQYDAADHPGVIVSTNGTNWSFFQTFGNVFDRTNFNAVSYANGLFVAVGQGLAATSYDGTNWALHTVPGSGSSTVAFGNGMWVAAGPSSDGGGTSRTYGSLVISTNGTNWMEQDPTFNGLHILFANGRFIASHGPFPSAPGFGHQGIRTSVDGTNWTEIAGTANIYPRRVTYGGGIYLGVGPSAGGTNFAVISLDGTNWTLRTIDGTNRLRSVTYGTNTFVAVGDVILQSEDIRPQLGHNYNAEELTHYINFIGLDNARYRIEASTNLVDWPEVYTFRARGLGQKLFPIDPGVPHQFFRAVQVPE